MKVCNYVNRPKDYFFNRTISHPAIFDSVNVVLEILRPAYLFGQGLQISDFQADDLLAELYVNSLSDVNIRKRL